MKELSFEFSHIHIGRAFGLAAFAGEAEVHDGMDFLTIERIFARGVSEGVAQDIGTSAGGVFFAASGHVTGAHGATSELGLTAISRAATGFGSPEDAFLCREIEVGVVFWVWVVRHVAECRIHGRGIHDFARIEDVFGVEESLSFADECEGFRANHELNEFSAQAAIAVLTAKGATVFFYEFGNSLSDVPELHVALSSLEVDHGTGVKLARSRMGVIDALNAKAIAHEGIKLGNVVGEVVHIHGGIFADFDRLGVTRNIGEETLASAAEVPNFVAISAEEKREGVAKTCGLESALQLSSGRGNFFAGFCS